MAEDMIGAMERAAQAVARDGWSNAPESDARLAVLAFLDPEDEALVERVGMEIADHTTGEYSRGLAQRIIATLRATAQGGQPVRSDKGPKD